ncbi:MAG: hypothetical protein ACXVXL_31295 [Solirubrobacteraceae bacterium]
MGGDAITSCTSAQVQSNVARGGSYAFACSSTIHFSAPLVVSQSVSVDATGQSVTLQWTAGIGQSLQAFVVDAGSLTLTSIAISGGVAVGALGTAGPTGVPSGDEVPQGQAGNGDQGGTGGPGTDPPIDARGGAMLIAPGASVFLNGGSISGAVASGDNGGRGGTGRTGGSAGDFMGSPGNGGGGGAGGDGSNGMGGAVYVSSGANLTVNGTAFSFDSASMGLAGPGGTGGSGGDSAWELVPPGTPYGAGADDGGTGSPGMALGGAIYNARTSRLPARRSATTRAIGCPGSRTGTGAPPGTGTNTRTSPV